MMMTTTAVKSGIKTTITDVLFILVLLLALDSTRGAAVLPWRRTSTTGPTLTTTTPNTGRFWGDRNGRFGYIQARSNPCQPSATMTSLVEFRGGAADDSDDNNEDEESEDDDEDDDDLFDFDDADLMDDNDNGGGGVGVDNAGFSEDGTLERTLEAWKKTPPLTKAYLSASMLATVAGFLFNGNQFPSILSLQDGTWKLVWQRLQLWRPITAFFNFGPLGLGYIMTGQFVWTYMSTLERLSYQKPYDFWIMILFGQVTMLIGYTVLRLSPRFLGHNLSTFFVYIWARYHEGMEVNLFELFNTRAELLPWFFLAQTFLLEGELPVLDFLGIVFGHIYHHCKTVGVLRAPKALVQWYEKGQSPLAVRIRQQYKDISTDFEI
jgi:Derlin-2/3